MVGLIGTYLTEFVRPVGHDHSKRLRTWRRQRRATRQFESAKKKQGELRRQLERERVGTRWLYHASPTDPGMDGEVVELDPRAWNRRVIVVWSNPSGRAKTDDDYYEGRTSMAWQDLVKPDEDQRHWTARMLRDSHDDSDGWVKYERLPHSK